MEEGLGREVGEFVGGGGEEGDVWVLRGPEGGVGGAEEEGAGEAAGGGEVADAAVVAEEAGAGVGEGLEAGDEVWEGDLVPGFEGEVGGGDVLEGGE